jgi:hypothetical protein
MTEIEDQDPLSELLVDATQIDRRAITDSLKGKVAIDAKTAKVVHLSGYNALDARRKILTILLARKAAHLLGIVASEGLQAKNVTIDTGLPGGTAAPSLKSLRELRFVGQDDAKAYLVPSPHLAAAIEFLRDA